ncbi:prepilin-type N-terminal cleavage/methylation domain-containing protein [Paraglaciecola aquimarina]|uniref:Prepilin-type N-terminal cleavage/methylation domain-containing protein n=1 Tax=Paraglaciecola aquimarina TaxID=1235557 RepID=A0ABU3SXN5_9ALTE|nr:prepilin-type N-terminal cleavage/methylation domain-containing protein [Paraglaciecola aquimarina]MDU0354776.1 prepilin-type N-terminal cleavage/methylation domain-containing protein [Paraglaciecola aquimarina]
MKKQKGFTLVELIIVIVILGILAVTAAPRFIDVSSDAKKATLHSMKAAIQAGANLVYAKSFIEGEHDNVSSLEAKSQILINGVTLETNFGYPSAVSSSQVSVLSWADLDFTNGYKLTIGELTDNTTPPYGSFGITLGTETPNFATNTCNLIYEEAATPDDVPDYIITDSGC